SWFGLFVRRTLFRARDRRTNRRTFGPTHAFIAQALGALGSGRSLVRVRAFPSLDRQAALRTVDRFCPPGWFPAPELSAAHDRGGVCRHDGHLPPAPRFRPGDLAADPAVATSGGHRL